MRVRDALGLLLGQLGLLTALAFYFGYARSSAYLGHFGVDPSVVDLSTTDYVLRSVSAAYWPLVLAASLVAAGLVLHPRAVRALQARSGLLRQRVLKVLATAGVALWLVAGVGLRQVVIFPRSIPVIPLALAAGAALLAYTAWLRDEFGPQRREVAVVRAVAALGAVVAGGLFWAWAAYAAEVGRGDARGAARDLRYRADVSVYSELRLPLDGPGVTVVEARGADSRYRFRYTGLALLIRSGDRYLLLPKGWRKGTDAVVVLPESDAVLIDIVAPPT